MQNNLIKSIFKDKEIRVINQDNDYWMPIKDISEAIGYNDRSVRTMLDRNVKLFEDFNRGITVILPSNQGVEMRCVNEQGFYMMMSKISVNEINDETVKDSIIEFNRFMVNELKRIREERQQKISGHGDFFEQELKIVEAMSKFMGIDKILLLNVAIERTEHYTGMDMCQYRNMLPAPQGVIAVHRATDIGKMHGIDAAQVNLILKELGLHEKVNKKWTLTKKGEKFGLAYFESKQHENGSYVNRLVLTKDECLKKWPCYYYKPKN